MRRRRLSWADAALTHPFSRGVWATRCSPAARQTRVGKLSPLFLMMLEHNGGACSPKECVTVRNWGEGAEAEL